MLDAVLARRGYQLKDVNAPPRGHQRFLEVYGRLAPKPATVIDVGVGRGTPWLYEAFPEAKLLLIEALEDFKPNIDEILRRRNAECVFAALGETEGEADFYVPHPVLTGASLFQRVLHRQERLNREGRGEVRKRTVRIRQLDSITSSCAGPHVLKIDVEGAELALLRGATATLQSTDLLLIESSVMQRWKGASDFVDVAAYLKTKGFALLEITEMATQGMERVLCYLDAAFVRADSDGYRRLLEAR
jgi:FkbM family methyltransferase